MIFVYYCYEIYTTCILNILIDNFYISLLAFKINFLYLLNFGREGGSKKISPTIDLPRIATYVCSKLGYIPYLPTYSRQVPGRMPGIPWIHF